MKASKKLNLWEIPDDNLQKLQCIARFMDKRKVRAAWTRFEDKHGNPDKE